VQVVVVGLPSPCFSLPFLLDGRIACRYDSGFFLLFWTVFLRPLLTFSHLSSRLGSSSLSPAGSPSSSTVLLTSSHGIPFFVPRLIWRRARLTVQQTVTLLDFQLLTVFFLIRIFLGRFSPPINRIFVFQFKKKFTNDISSVLAPFSL